MVSSSLTIVFAAKVTFFFPLGVGGAEDDEDGTETIIGRGTDISTGGGKAISLPLDTDCASSMFSLSKLPSINSDMMINDG